MIKNAFIWKESIYKNDFICQCGEKLTDENGTPIKKLLHGIREQALYCPKCKMKVARIKQVDIPEEMSGKQGSWDEFKKRQSNQGETPA